MQGRFVLRIEDTDTARSTDESVQAIFDALNWLGIDWDDGPYFQTRRLDIYKEYLDKMIAADKAYYCTCSPEQIDEMRKKAMAAGEKPKYDGTCRNKGLSDADNAAVRFKAPRSGTTVINDVIKGDIAFQNDELDDFIIRRSAGMPTYNFVVVVDDITMGINTVIRGDDHVNNTPKQIQLYHALGAKLPVFGHVPMVLGQDRARLSKRHGAMAVTAYREMGFLPDALVNFLVRLGWSHGDQEFFTRKELIECFTLENIGKSPGVFNQEKLLALNAEHIRHSTPQQLLPHLRPFLKAREFEMDDPITPESEKLIDTLSPRSKTLEELAENTRFFYESEIQYEEKAAKKFLKSAALAPLEQVYGQLESLPDFEEKALEDAFRAVMESSGLKLGKIAQPVRVALTGKTVSPGIFEVIALIGRSKTLSRIQAAIEFIRQKMDKVTSD
jgi:glutamyl-tRNA synthetase